MKIAAHDMRWKQASAGLLVKVTPRAKSVHLAFVQRLNVYPEESTVDHVTDEHRDTKKHTQVLVGDCLAAMQKHEKAEHADLEQELYDREYPDTIEAVDGALLYHFSYEIFFDQKLLQDTLAVGVAYLRSKAKVV
jgi:hypothetical protein